MGGPRCFICTSYRRLSCMWPWQIQVTFLIAVTYANRNVWEGERNQRGCRPVSFVPSCLRINAGCYCGFSLPSSLGLPRRAAFNGFLFLADNFSAHPIYLLRTCVTFDYPYLFWHFLSFWLPSELLFKKAYLYFNKGNKRWSPAPLIC